jgi:uncharacterized protein YfkK (UPF0435 family)
MIKKVKRKVGLSMDLNTPSIENVIYMIEQIKEKLRMVNVDAMQSDKFDEAKYEDLQYLYDMVMKRDSFSPSEMEAIVAELGTLRK